MYNELNIDVLERLMDAPKPKQIYVEGNTMNCLEVDLIRCRRSVLERSAMGSTAPAPQFRSGALSNSIEK